MGTELSFIQSVADQFPSRAAAIIINAGCVLAGYTPRTKGIIELSLLQPPGTVFCDANVSLLVGAGAKHPNAARFFNWSYTLDMGKTYLTAPSTPKGKTTIRGLPLLTEVGFRVNLNTDTGPGTWSQTIYILVH